MGKLVEQSWALPKVHWSAILLLELLFFFWCPVICICFTLCLVALVSRGEMMVLDGLWMWWEMCLAADLGVLRWGGLCGFTYGGAGICHVFICVYKSVVILLNCTGNSGMSLSGKDGIKCSCFVVWWHHWLLPVCRPEVQGFCGILGLYRVRETSA